jgi:hypothetical protein
MKSNRRLWGPDEDATLAREIMAGKSAAEIAEKIGRTLSAVQNRAAVLRLSFSKLRLRKPTNQ